MALPGSGDEDKLALDQQNLRHAAAVSPSNRISERYKSSRLMCYTATFLAARINCVHLLTPLQPVAAHVCSRVCEITHQVRWNHVQVFSSHQSLTCLFSSTLVVTSSVLAMACSHCQLLSVHTDRSHAVQPKENNLL